MAQQWRGHSGTGAAACTADRGFVNGASAQSYGRELAAFLKGLSEAGYVDGENVVVEYRWADGQNDRLPGILAELIHKQVAVIAATSTPAALAAKAATTTIPIVLEMGGDPVQLGLVASLDHPGGNVTGVTQLAVGLSPKRLQLLHELLPRVRIMAFLVHPDDPFIAESQSREVRSAARDLGLEPHVLNASSLTDLHAVFAKLTEIRAGGLVVGGSVFFASHSEQLAALAVQHAIPAIYASRSFAAAGGLMSYGSNITESYRLVGVYTGRVLKGDKPADCRFSRQPKSS